MKIYILLLLTCFVFVQYAKAQTLNYTPTWNQAGADGWVANYSGASDNLFNPNNSDYFGYDDSPFSLSGSFGDFVILTSPAIDLTAAAAAGEQSINVSTPLSYNNYVSGTLDPTDFFLLEWYDADAGVWNVWFINRSSDVGCGGSGTEACYDTGANQVPVTTSTLNVSDFTATQLAGFQVRYTYYDGDDWSYGFSMGAPTVSSEPHSPVGCENGLTPICLESGVSYAAATDSGDGLFDQPFHDYGCLGAVPNPGWYYFEVATAGNFELVMTNSEGIDVDVAMFGPFSDLATAEGNCGSYGNGGSGGAAPCTADPCATCDYTTNPGATLITTGAVGDIFVIVVANFANDPTLIQLASGAGTTGTTDCAVLPPSCNACASATCNNTGILANEASATSGGCTGGEIRNNPTGTETFCTTLTTPATLVEDYISYGLNTTSFPSAACNSSYPTIARTMYDGCGTVVAPAVGVTAPSGRPAFPVTANTTYQLCYDYQYDSGTCDYFSNPCIRPFWVPAPVQNCGTVAFEEENPAYQNAGPINGNIYCATDPVVNLVSLDPAYDPNVDGEPPYGEYNQPGYYIAITTDSFSDTENSYTITQASAGINFNYPIGSVIESGIEGAIGWYFDANSDIVLTFSDSFPDGVFPYTITDLNGNLITSGTFDFDNAGGATSLSVTFQVSGIATFSGTGVVNDPVASNGDGTGSFDPGAVPSPASTGTSVDITYTWDDENGCTGMQTQTVTVFPEVTGTPTSADCGVAASVTQDNPDFTVSYTISSDGASNGATGTTFTTAEMPAVGESGTVTFTITNPNADASLGDDCKMLSRTVAFTCTNPCDNAPTAVADATVNCGDSFTLDVVQPAGFVFTDISAYTGTCTEVDNTPHTAVNLTDDSVMSDLEIGFSFDFFGNVYTQFNIHSNGFISFGSENYTGYANFNIPNTSSPDNFIAAIYGDLNPSCGGSITYATVGTTPNQQLIVTYEDIEPYDGGCGATPADAITSQIVLNEDGTFYVMMIDYPSSFAASTAIGNNVTSGYENLDGTIADAATGYNGESGSYINESSGDSPLCWGAAPIVSNCTFTRWENSAGTTIGTTEQLSITPTATDTYTAVWDCAGTECTDEVIVTTNPNPCPAACSAPTGMPMITESACATGCAPAGGSIAVGTLACATGTLNYSTDGGTNWSATIPTYNQTTAMNVMVSCDCDNSLTAGPFTTVPGTCTNPADPTGSLMVTNSTCGAGCAVSGGSIAIGSVMGTGGTLEYSTDGGTNWSASLPAYSAPQTIMASVVDANGCRSGMVNVGVTVAGTCTDPTFTGSASCSGGLGTGSISQSASGGSGSGYTYAISGGSFGPTLANGTYNVTVTDSNGCNSTADVAVNCTASCPTGLAAATAPQADITESTCTTHGGTPSGGSVNNTTGCPAGSTIEYSVDGGTNWVTDPSSLYDQSNLVTIMTRCYCAADGGVASMTNTIDTEPGVCPTCNDGVMNGDETGIDCGGANCLPCSTDVTISISDPCNCANSIVVGGVTYAQETITITPGVANYSVTAVTGLFDAAGVAYTTATATAAIDQTGLTLVGYVPADGASTYDITIQDSAVPATSDSIVGGGPCASCAPACNANAGTFPSN